MTSAQALLRILGGRQRPARSAAPLRERMLEGALLSCGVLSVFVTLGILGTLLYEAVGFFREVTFAEFFGSTRWTPQFATKKYGVWPLVSGTVLTAGIAIAVAVPFGLLAAIYLSEFASPRTRKIVKPVLELLAGVPTIVYGYFALVFLTPMLQEVVPGLAGYNALSPGLIMGVMIIPMISSLSEDALHAVPNSLREGSYALGAAKLPTIFRVVVPSATSGITAAVVLAVSRAIGETMIVTVAAGQQPNFTLDPRVPIETMTAFIINMTTGDTATGSTEYRTIFAVGTLLFVMTFAMNLLSYRMASKMRKKGGT